MFENTIIRTGVVYGISLLILSLMSMIIPGFSFNMITMTGSLIGLLLYRSYEMLMMKKEV